MRMKLNPAILAVLLMCMIPCSCDREDPVDNKDPYEEIAEDDANYINRCDFESKILTWRVNGSCSYDVVSNPDKKGINKSSKCGKIVTSKGTWEHVFAEDMPRKLDFTAFPAIFKLKVMAPREGATVALYLTGQGLNPIAVRAKVKKADVWHTLVFDFTSLKPESNIYSGFKIYFDPGEAYPGETWYIDDLLCPSDDLTSICLFKRYSLNPVFNPDGSRTWRGDHMANAAILTPEQTPDNTWRVYLRGSGSCPTYCDQIGLYTQSAESFKPFGPWKEYEHNPVLPVGPAGSYDAGFLLDAAPVFGPDGTLYVYYNGQTANHASHGLCVRYSTDGGYTFQRTPAPLVVGRGCSDAVYHDGKFYIYYGGGDPCRLYVAVTEDPLSLKDAQTYETIPIGGGPSNFDSFAVNGSMVFRVKGVDKWFASYQGSSHVYDFPDRFHVAMSDDLIHWTKVDNDQPLFTRGSPGAWDQGAVWFCEIFEYEDMMYLYYEGWGRTGYVPNRDQAYFAGQSRVGAASCSKADFLKWCGIDAAAN